MSTSVIREKTGRSSEFADILQLIETRVVAVTSDVVTFSGLNGDADGTYILEGIIIAGDGGANNIHLRPNGSDANTLSISLINTGAVLVPTAPAYLILGENGPINTMSYFKCEFLGSKLGGLLRGGWATGMRGIGVANIGFQSQFGWNDGTNLLVSLDIFVEGGLGTGIKAGSKISLWKLKH